MMDQEIQRDIESQDEALLAQLPESELIGINIICRLCANPNERIIGIYSEEGISNDLANKMNTYLPVKVSENDTLPLQCCWSCASTVLAWHELVVASVEADRRLRGLQVVPDKASINEDYSGLDDTAVDDPGSPPTQEDKGIEEEVSTTTQPVKKENNSELDTKCVLSSNKENEEEEEYTHCSVCSIKFSSQKYLAIHQYKKHGIGELPVYETVRAICEICKTTFKRRCDMLRHVKQQHVEKKPTKRRRRVDIEYEIFCDICNTGFTRSMDMEKHRTKKHPDVLNSFKNQTKVEIKEEDCDNIKSEENSNFIKTVAGSFMCIICDINFKGKADLNKHLKDDHGQRIPRFRRSKSDIVAEHFCDVCGKGFTRKFDMQKHRKGKHPNEPKPEEEPTQQQKNLQLLKRCKVPSDDNKSYYKCEECGRLFRQSYNFMRHQTVHTGVRAFFCHICGKNFRVSGGLYRHITEHHYGIKKYECDVCGKSFAAKATRDDHRNIHTDDRPFICDICGKAFRQKASLHIHKLFHTDNYRFSCNVCGKKYRRASELKIHSWLHTGHKPHQCTVCGSRFRLRQDLKRHLKIHDKVSECVCNECGSTFSQERYLKNHKKTHRIKGAVPFVIPPLPQLL